MARFFLALLSATLLFQATAPSAAEACRCIADPYSKKYLELKKTWYGSKRKWTCVYTCQNSRQQQIKIIGTHQDWYTTDSGLEGICDGLHYINEYNMFKNDFVWLFDEARYFAAADSSAPEIKSWQNRQCR